MTTVEDLLRPPVLGAIADDDHAPHIVETVERLADLHDLRPLYLHVCGHYLAAPVICRVGAPYEEPPLPDLTISEAENAYIAWRSAQPILAHAGVAIGREAYILAGGPPVLALREMARKLRAAAIVVGRGTPRRRVVRYLAGDTAPGVARSFPTPAVFVDDAPLTFDKGPIACVLPPEPDAWDDQLHTATTLASRSGTTLGLHAVAPAPARRARLPVEPTPLPAGRPASTAIAALAERSRPALVIVPQPETSPLRAFARGSLAIDLLTSCDAPIMTCPERRAARNVC